MSARACISLEDYPLALIPVELKLNFWMERSVIINHRLRPGSSRSRRSVVSEEPDYVINGRLPVLQFALLLIDLLQKWTCTSLTSWMIGTDPGLLRYRNSAFTSGRRVY